MRLVRIAECPAVAWKNGGGTTQDIAVYPQDAGMDDFIWRLSSAQVAVPGVFSRFADVDRIIAILSGTLDLAIEGRQPVRLVPDSRPYSFPGDVTAAANPVCGRVVDLNLMLRRGYAQAEMIATSAGRIDIVSPMTIILACRGGILRIGEAAFELCEGDAAIFDGPSENRVILNAPSLIIYLEVAS